jgi:hypothetical protein
VGEVKTARDWQLAPTERDLRAIALGEEEHVVIRWADTHDPKVAKALGGASHERMVCRGDPPAEKSGYVRVTGDQVKVGRSTLKSRGNHLLPLLVLASMTAIGISLWAFLSQDAEGRDKVAQEVAKVTWQFLLIGVLGGFVTYLLQQRQTQAADARADAQRLIAERAAMDEFRTEILRRTVAVTSAVRRVPLMVSARRSYRTYDTQMRAVIDAYLDLRALHHEVDNFGIDGNAAFKEWGQIRDRMETMETYLGSLCAEFASDQSKDISELQVKAEKDRARQPEVWDRLRGLPVLGDMLQEAPDLHGSRKEVTATNFYASYMEPYGDALKLMRAELLRPAPSPPQTVDDDRQPRVAEGGLRPDATVDSDDNGPRGDEPDP